MPLSDGDIFTDFSSGVGNCFFLQFSFVAAKGWYGWTCSLLSVFFLGFDDKQVFWIKNIKFIGFCICRIYTAKITVTPCVVRISLIRNTEQVYMLKNILCLQNAKRSAHFEHLIFWS